MSAPLDLAVLRTVKRRAQWEKIRGFVKDSGLDEHTKLILGCYRRYFDMHPTSEVVDMDVFRSLFFSTWNRSLSVDSVSTYNQLLDRCCDDVSPEQQANIVNSLLEQEFVTFLANDIDEYEQGEEIDIVRRVEHRVSTTKDKLEIINSAAYGTTASLKDKRESGLRLKHPLRCLNHVCREVEGGDMIIIAALTDVGKTALAMMYAVAFSVQTKYPLIWFNNEGPKERIQKRFYSMMLGINSASVDAHIDNNTLDEALFRIYQRPDPVRVYDVHQYTNVQLEELIKSVYEQEGGLAGVVWDMLDNVTFRSGMQSARKDEILEEKYQWARQLGVTYDFPNLATSQQSYAREWQQWPDRGELKDSKVGKQGACDMLLFMTQPVEHTKETFRYLSAPKNKLRKIGAPSLHHDARFNNDRGVVYEE